MSLTHRDGSLELPFVPPQIREAIQTVRARSVALAASWPKHLAIRTTGPLSMYDCLPHVFAGAFPTIAEERLTELAVATRQYSTAMFLADRIMDHDDAAAKTVPATLSLLACLFEADGLLRSLFPCSSQFWDRLRQCQVELAAVTFEEYSFVTGNRPWAEYTEDVARRLARGKSGTMRAVPAGLAEFAQDEQPYAILCESIDAYNFAVQMLDDVSDWRSDLSNNKPSLALARVFTERPVPPQSTNEAARPWFDEAGRSLYYEGHTQYCLTLAVTTLNTALEHLGNLPPMLWTDILYHLRSRCRESIEDTERILKRNGSRAQALPTTKVELPPATNVAQAVVHKALRNLAETWKSGWGEAKHVVMFPMTLGFDLGREYVRGDTFQRALIIDALADVARACPYLAEDLQGLLEFERDALWADRDNDCPGLWRYFKDFALLPPDTDTVGQVLKALGSEPSGASVARDAQACLECIFALQDPFDGSLPYFVTNPPSGDVANPGGLLRLVSGLEFERGLMATLLAALDAVRVEQYAAPIQRALGYLKSQQASDGSWVGRRFGTYYTTAVSMKALARHDGNSPSLLRAVEFIVRSQRQDGSWGKGASGDPLSTAAALQGLASAGRLDLLGVASAGLTFLNATSDKEGWWRASDLMRLVFEIPGANSTYQIAYRSKTATAALAMQSATAWLHAFDTQPAGQTELIQE